MQAVATLLSAVGRGETRALGDLYTLLYADLLRLARSRVRRSGDATTLEPGALVHESFLRFARSGPADLRDREHFLGYAAHVMRSVMVDAARRRGSDRHGGGAVHVAFDEQTDRADADAAQACLAGRVRESLDELAASDARVARVVEMRYFTGLTEDETAAALGVGVRTVARDWEKARTFLQASLR